MPNRLLSTQEVAQRTGLSVYTINRYARDGKLPVAMQLPGSKGARLYDPDDVERLAAEQAAPEPQAAAG